MDNFKIGGRPQEHLTQLEAVESYLKRYIHKGVAEITIKKLRDNLRGLTVFQDVDRVQSLIKNKLIPVLIEKGLCELEGSTIILKGDSNV